MSKTLNSKAGGACLTQQQEVYLQTLLNRLSDRRITSRKTLEKICKMSLNYILLCSKNGFTSNGNKLFISRLRDMQITQITRLIAALIDAGYTSTDLLKYLKGGRKDAE